MVRRLLFVLVLLSAAPAVLRAQPAWDSPQLLRPAEAPGMGIYLIDPAGAGIGVMGLYRSPAWNWGIRFALADSPRDGVAVFGGVDFAGAITRASPDFPLDVDWLVGIGAGIDDVVRLSVPLGLTTGHTFRGQGANFTPYITPRVVFDAWLGDERPRRSTRLGLAVDLGLDLDLLRNFIVRFAATIGDRDAVAIGVHF